MKLLVANYFFMIAIIQIGLLMGVFYYQKSDNQNILNRYWLASLGLSSAALIIFGASILYVDDVMKPVFTFTIANTLFYISSVLQVLFCISLNREVTKNQKILSLISIFYVNQYPYDI